MAYDIFISYRRDGGFDTAKHLYDLLSHDKYSVSFDIDTLRNGLWTEELDKRISECKDFIIILSKGALDRSVDPSVPRENDWLRRELAKAISLKKNIIPVILSGFDEFPKNLPADIRIVKEINGPKYDHYYFDAFYNVLKTKFLLSRPSLMEQSSLLKLQTDTPCRVLIDGTERCILYPGNMSRIPLRQGTYSVTFIDVGNPRNYSTTVISVYANSESLYFVNLKKIRKTPSVLALVLSGIVALFMVGIIIAMVEDDGTAPEEQASTGQSTVQTDSTVVDLYPYKDDSTGLWGYRNGNGDSVFVPQFTFASQFENGSALVEYEGRFYEMDPEGNMTDLSSTTSDTSHSN